MAGRRDARCQPRLRPSARPAAPGCGSLPDVRFWPPGARTPLARAAQRASPAAYTAEPEAPAAEPEAPAVVSRPHAGLDMPRRAQKTPEGTDNVVGRHAPCPAARPPGAGAPRM